MTRDETEAVEAVAVAAIVFGPVVGILLLLVKAIRRLLPRVDPSPPWGRSGVDGPPRGPDPAGDREPRRPLTPSRSGAVALAPPPEDAGDCDVPPVRRTVGPAGPAEPGHRLAG